MPGRRAATEVNSALLAPRHGRGVELGPVELFLDAVEGVVADDAARPQVGEHAPLGGLGEGVRALEQRAVVAGAGVGDRLDRGRVAAQARDVLAAEEVAELAG